MRTSSWKQIFDWRSLRQIKQTRLQGRPATGAASAIRFEWAYGTRPRRDFQTESRGRRSAALACQNHQYGAFTKII